MNRRDTTSRSRQSLWAVFAAPIIIAILSTVGLVVALAGDGWHDILSWLTLGVPVAAIVWAMKARRS
ncbi:hypothetical protein [Niveispirillum sp. KHB5.9]|uniref:hypothetical protein n=1 Tax=Niveispirillum sp. KHB5.9 TaxID=3400269 RepID=UPI003A83A585